MKILSVHMALLLVTTTSSKHVALAKKRENGQPMKIEGGGDYLGNDALNAAAAEQSIYDHEASIDNEKKKMKKKHHRVSTTAINEYKNHHTNINPHKDIRRLGSWSDLLFHPNDMWKSSSSSSKDAWASSSSTTKDS